MDFIIKLRRKQTSTPDKLDRPLSVNKDLNILDTEVKAVKKEQRKVTTDKSLLRKTHLLNPKLIDFTSTVCHTRRPS